MRSPIMYMGYVAIESALYGVVAWGLGSEALGLAHSPSLALGSAVFAARFIGRLSERVE